MQNPKIIIISFSKFVSYVKDDIKFFIPVAILLILLQAVSIFIFQQSLTNIFIAENEKNLNNLTNKGYQSLIFDVAKWILNILIIFRAARWIGKDGGIEIYVKDFISFIVLLIGIALSAFIIYILIPILIIVAFFNINIESFLNAENAKNILNISLIFSFLFSYFYLFTTSVLIFDGKKGFKNLFKSLTISMKEPIIILIFAGLLIILNYISLSFISIEILKKIIIYFSSIIKYLVSVLLIFLYGYFINKNNRIDYENNISN